MNQRIRRIADWLCGDYTNSQLANRVNINRPPITLTSLRIKHLMPADPITWQVMTAADAQTTEKQ